MFRLFQLVKCLNGLYGLDAIKDVIAGSMQWTNYHGTMSTTSLSYRLIPIISQVINDICTPIYHLDTLFKWKWYSNEHVQEPGVYMVFVTAILQDACLSIKIASNLAEREVLVNFYFSDIFSFFSLLRFCAWDHETVLSAVLRPHMFVEMECFRSLFLIKDVFMMLGYCNDSFLPPSTTTK